MKHSSRVKVITLVVLLLAVPLAARTSTQEDRKNHDGPEWEYLAVAGPATTSFSSSGNPRLRKDSTGTFAREAFVLEQHLDKLGAQGWELIVVAGTPTDPVFYFKRRK